jgi:hypothetical protein
MNLAVADVASGGVREPSPSLNGRCRFGSNRAFGAPMPINLKEVLLFAWVPFA